MAAKRYTVIAFENPELQWEIHKLGCKLTPKAADAKEFGPFQKSVMSLDLEDSDEELLAGMDAFLEMTMEDVDLCACTETEEKPAPPTDPQPMPAIARASQAAAAKRLLEQVEATIDKLVVARGVDDIGEGDRWSDERLPSCTDDYVYDLAVEVRKQRERGDSWWRVAYELGLPGSGASNRQGRKGGAFARRLWRAAWGKTYLGERGQRESKVAREARAMENLGRPYFTGSEDGVQIIETIRGQMMHWVTRLEGKHGLITSAQEAWVHDDPKYIRVKQGPQGPYVEFYEQLDPAMVMVDPRKSITKSGPLRAVYLDRITRVGA